MIPILYEKTETAFTSNGIGRLTDCLSCLVTEERNGIYEVEFTYPVSGVRFEDITIGRIISCTHDEQGDAQPFDIYAKSEPINGVVTFRGRHISYRLNEITVKPFTAGSCAAAIAGLKTNSIGTNPFTFWTDKSVTSDYAVAVPSKLRGLLGGEENSLLDVYGTGEYEFSKFDVKLYLHRGQDTNVGIRYGKNLVDFTNEYSAGDIYTAVVPFWSGSETVGDQTVTVVVTLPEWYISSGQSSPGGREIIVPMDLSADFSTKPTANQLRTLATSRLSSSDAWVPAQTITVDFVQLWQTDEYKDYAPLQRLKLCDTCGVFVPMYGISLRVKVIKAVYNTLLDRYDSMELGDKPTTYAAVLEKSYDSKVAGILEGLQALSVDIGTVEANAKNYTDGEITSLRNDLETQIDAKIETWAQSSNPATAWTTAELRTEHNGDLWLYTGTSSITVGGVTIYPQGVYQYNGSTNTWAAYSSTSNNLFDLVDGKSTIFYGTPSGTYNNKEVGDYLVDSTDGSTYRWNGSSWAKQTDYSAAITSAINSLKTTLETQIDGLVETWAQSTNPATNWTTAEIRAQHNGDLWLYTGTSDTTVGGVTIHPQGVYQYNGANNTWVAYSSTSANLFDLADGKTTIFYGPTSGTYNNKEVGDYLVDNTTGSTYRWSGSAWVKQTDYATAISNATTSITGAYQQAIADATNAICGGTGGYIITTLNGNGQPIELLITDNIDINQAVNVWRWNSGGLGHSHSGYAGPFNDIAITQDGKINASMILTGALTANLITAGTIVDSSGKNSWNLDSGEFVTAKGTIANFEITDTTLENNKGGYASSLSRQSIRISYTNSSGMKNESELSTYYLVLNRKNNVYDGVFWLSIEGTGSYPYLAMTWDGDTSGDIFNFYYPTSGQSYLIEAKESMKITGNFFVASGYSKSKECDTENYGKRLQYCYETPTPLFGDIGEAVLDEDGICYVDLDDIFTETIAERAEYQAFLQKEGPGDCWIADKTPRYFVINGTPGLKVAWELKAKQKNFENVRLELSESRLDEYDRTSDINISLDDYIKEQEELLYG